MKIGDILRKIGSSMKKIPSLRPSISHSSLLRGILLFLILVIASGVRLLPLRWGFYLNEFDPYFHYYVAKNIAEKGLTYWLSWHDYRGWYPYGRNMPHLSNLGLTLTAVTLYKILSFLGVPLKFGLSSNPLDPLGSDPLYNLCVIFPIIMAALTCIVIYFLGRDLDGEAVGLFSALLLALDSSYIGRTSLGWFDDETVGILSTLLFMLFFSRSIDVNKPMKYSTLYAVASGLSLAYLCASWGAARYVVGIAALFTFILLVLRKYTPRLLVSYAVMFGVAFAIVANIPRLGLKFLFENFNLVVYGVLVLLCMAEINRRVTSVSKKMVCMAIPLLLAAATYVFLVSRGFIKPIGTKFLLALNPAQRSKFPLFESVAEHKPSSWATFYYNSGVSLIFVPVGVFFATLLATNLSILIIIYCLTSIYFASSMIRLNILASPAISLLCALALKRVLTPLILTLKEKVRPFGRKAKFRSIGKDLIGGLLVLMLMFFSLTYVFGTDFIFPHARGPRFILQADSPATIAGASVSAKPTATVRDWIDTLIWMRENLPPSPSGPPPPGAKPGEVGTVVASWWDYGYWITVFANKTTLADNGTWNTTQIQQIGRMFMSNETEAIKILRKYFVTHVVVFVTFDTQGRDAPGYGGDNGKWRWMALIPGLNDTDFGNYTLGWDWIDSNRNYRVDSGEIIPNRRGQDTVLYKLMTYGRETTLYGYSTINLKYFEKAYFSQKEGQPTPAPGTSIVPLVCVYKVNYPMENTNSTTT
ncbi:hypothetical protein J7L27_00865 [Candidatus Bathyarchaeota archaeon]|nr:hypothetical protein [Candidatus Bathyarchaeota archaeon]